VESRNNSCYTACGLVIRNRTCCQYTQACRFVSLDRSTTSGHDSTVSDMTRNWRRGRVGMGLYQVEVVRTRLPSLHQVSVPLHCSKHRRPGVVKRSKPNLQEPRYSNSYEAFIDGTSTIAV
jgi:hypothetical protein